MGIYLQSSWIHLFWTAAICRWNGFNNHSSRLEFIWIVMLWLFSNWIMYDRWNCEFVHQMVDQMRWYWHIGYGWPQFGLTNHWLLCATFEIAWISGEINCFTRSSWSWIWTASSMWRCTIGCGQTCCCSSLQSWLIGNAKFENRWCKYSRESTVQVLSTGMQLRSWMRSFILSHSFPKTHTKWHNHSHAHGQSIQMFWPSNNWA